MAKFWPWRFKSSPGHQVMSSRAVVVVGRCTFRGVIIEQTESSL